jgi:hypothetical protein
MREYELVFIVHPDLDETATNEIAERVKSWITEAGGTVDKSIPGENVSWHTRFVSKTTASIFFSMPIYPHLLS